MRTTGTFVLAALTGYAIAKHGGKPEGEHHGWPSQGQMSQWIGEHGGFKHGPPGFKHGPPAGQHGPPQGAWGGFGGKPGKGQVDLPPGVHIGIPMNKGQAGGIPAWAKSGRPGKGMKKHHARDIEYDEDDDEDEEYLKKRDFDDEEIEDDDNQDEDEEDEEDDDAADDESADAEDDEEAADHEDAEDDDEEEEADAVQKRHAGAHHKAQWSGSHPQGPPSWFGGAGHGKPPGGHGHGGNPHAYGPPKAHGPPSGLKGGPPAGFKGGPPGHGDFPGFGGRPGGNGYPHVMAREVDVDADAATNDDQYYYDIGDEGDEGESYDGEDEDVVEKREG